MTIQTMKKEFKVGEVSYITRKFPAREGLAIHMKLVNVFSSSLSGLFGVVAEHGTDATAAELAPHIISVADSIFEKDPELQLLFKLMKYTVREGKPLSDGDNFDDAYAGNYDELLSAVIEVVKANNFFTKIIGLFQGRSTQV